MAAGRSRRPEALAEVRGEAGAALAGPTCLKPLADGVQLDLSVMPNARRTQVDGFHDGALRLRLAAPPVDGQANARLLAWLADALGCPKRAVRLLRGETQRRKQVAIALPPDRVAAWVLSVTAEPPAPGAAATQG